MARSAREVGVCVEGRLIFWGGDRDSCFRGLGSSGVGSRVGYLLSLGGRDIAAPGLLGKKDTELRPVQPRNMS
jgi:hypothetical protein